MTQWIVSSAVLILAVVLLRALFGVRIKPTFRYALWLLVLLRMLIPGTFGNSPASVATAVEALRDEPAVELAETMSQTALPSMSWAEADRQLRERYAEQGVDVDEFDLNRYNRYTYEVDGYRRTGVRLTPRDLLRIGWLGGLTVALLVFLFQNLRLRRRLRQNRVRVDADCPLPVYAVEGLGSSCLFGRAVYVDDLTAGDETRLRHVLAHEVAHHRHGDTVWALLRCFVLALHWYDPLVWWAASLSRQDAELAADAGALEVLGEGERDAYGDTLIRLSAAYAPRVSLLCSATTMTGDKRRLGERVRHVARRYRTPLLAALAVLALAAVAAGCAFAGAQKPTEAPKPTELPVLASGSDLTDGEYPIETQRIPQPSPTRTPGLWTLTDTAEDEFVPYSVSVVNLVSSTAHPFAQIDAETVEELYALYQAFRMAPPAEPDLERLRESLLLSVSFTSTDGRSVKFDLWGPYYCILDEKGFLTCELEDGEAIYERFRDAVGRWAVSAAETGETYTLDPGADQSFVSERLLWARQGAAVLSHVDYRRDLRVSLRTEHIGRENGERTAEHEVTYFDGDRTKIYSRVTWRETDLSEAEFNTLFPADGAGLYERPRYADCAPLRIAALSEKEGRYLLYTNGTLWLYDGGLAVELIPEAYMFATTADYNNAIARIVGYYEEGSLERHADDCTTLLSWTGAMRPQGWEKLNAAELNALTAALRAAAVGDEQSLRDNWMMNAAKTADGAFAALFFDPGGLLHTQYQADPEAFDAALAEQNADFRAFVETSRANWT